MSTSQRTSVSPSALQKTPGAENESYGKRRAYPGAGNGSSRPAKTPRTPNYMFVSELNGRLDSVPAAPVPSSWEHDKTTPATAAEFPQPPTLTYYDLASKALSVNHDGLRLHEIVDWVQQRYPGYVRDTNKLKGGISGALSSRSRGEHPIFLKSQRSAATGYQGAHWTLIATPSACSIADLPTTDRNTMGLGGGHNQGEGHDGTGPGTDDEAILRTTRTNRSDGRELTASIREESSNVSQGRWRNWTTPKSTQDIETNDFSRTDAVQEQSPDLIGVSLVSAVPVTDKAILPGSPLNGTRPSLNDEGLLGVRRSPLTRSASTSIDRPAPSAIVTDTSRPPLTTVGVASTRSSGPANSHDQRDCADIPSIDTSYAALRSFMNQATETINTSAVLQRLAPGRRLEPSIAAFIAARLQVWSDSITVPIKNLEDIFSLRIVHMPCEDHHESLGRETLLDAINFDANLVDTALELGGTLHDAQQGLTVLHQRNKTISQIDLTISVFDEVRSRLVATLNGLETVLKRLDGDTNLMERDRKQVADSMLSLKQGLVEYITKS